MSGMVQINIIHAHKRYSIILYFKMKFNWKRKGAEK